MSSSREISEFYGVGSVGWQQAGLKLSESTYPPSFKMPSHAHDEAYLGVVLSGGYTERVGKAICDRKPLTTVFHPRGELHSVEFNSRVRIFHIEITREFCGRLAQYSALPKKSEEGYGGPLASLAIRLHNEFRSRDSWSELSIEGLTLEIMAQLARSWSRAAEGAAPAWLDRIRQRLCSRVADPPTLAELAEDAGVHPVHLARQFRKHFRCTIGDFIRRVRIEFACREIAETDAPLSEVAIALGFYDQSHFCNTFRRFTGTTPAAYRAVCRAG